MKNIRNKQYHGDISYTFTSESIYKASLSSVEHFHLWDSFNALASSPVSQSANHHD